MNQKIGIFSGSFDPIHEGHLAFAKAAIEAAGLDKVVFLPEPVPRRKINVSSVAQRINWIENQIADSTNLDVLHIDQSQFTVDDTMPVIEKLYPSANFSLLIGSDIVNHLHYWQHFESVRQKYPLIVAMRAGFDDSTITEYLDALGVNYKLVTAPYNDVSSTQKKST